MDVDLHDVAIGPRGEVWVAGAWNYEGAGGPYVVVLEPGLGVRREVSVAAGGGSATSVTLDAAGNAYIAGTTSGTAGTEPPEGLVESFAPDLTERWTRSWAGTAIAGVSLRSGGDIVIAGTLSRPTDFGGGVRPAGATFPIVFVLALDRDGSYLWDRELGPWYYLGGLASGPTGAITVVGALWGSIDLGAGRTRASAGMMDALVLGLDASGSYLWDREWGLADEDEADRVAARADGSVVIVGTFNGAFDFGGGTRGGAVSQSVVLALGPDGRYLWDDPWASGSGQPGWARAVAAWPDGSVYVAGIWWGPDVDLGCGPLHLGGAAAALLGYRPDGRRAFVRVWPATGESAASTATAVATGAAGQSVVAGVFTGDLDLGGGVRRGVYTFSSDNDAFVVLLADPMR